MSPSRPLRTVVTLTLVGLLGACGGAGGVAGPASGDNGTPVQGGTLTYLEHQPPTCLYLPAAGFYPNGGILNQITDKLTWQNPETLEIEPWIATKWEINEDATEYTFHLRDGVTFSDGTKLDADAVAANFDVYGLGDDKLKLPVAEFVNNYERSEVLDPLTVRFHFDKPSPGFLQGTSVIGAGLVSKKTISLPYEQQCQLKNIVGSGPFTVRRQVVDKEVDLVARKDYNWAPPSSKHQGRAYLDEIKIIVTPEDNVRVGALTSGQADMVRYVQAYDEQTVKDAGFTIYAEPTRGVNNGLYLRPGNSLIKDVNVRTALRLGTNAKEIVDTLFTPSYPVATSVLSHLAQGYVDLSKELVHDPAKANALLDQAGWARGADGVRVKDGKQLRLGVFVSGPQPLSKQTLELVAQQWTKLGVKLEIRPADAGTQAVDIKDAEKTAIQHGMVGRADQDVIKSHFHSENRDVILSDDEKLDRLLEEESAEPDVTKRNAKVAEIQRYVIEQGYAIPLFEEPQVYGAAPYVRGVAFEAVARPWFYSVWKARQ
ncbi:TIGR04028 family ABC transporter substrate-binding protein [Nonomuraea gerenzanensis]|uniref:ABC-type dipeptide transport system, periplasmic component n=1 Tax=Nonomuraea gerenzanensis TaxID=93944 RepID=A0A1M4ECH7_9ACTN|nr:TIGR04028 family ABC transporter substrate-binding protein [Nonomuraea gerenzanensis]UBU08340.1 TIGR04028 family ABC transporter substrate-binding protein [Nonomuraea gerenzanensis]SBO96677.1 ABC-type dipeptide transport system, periplasmic component [Nonomuraea gerenzanensis]